jgi:hypothetical protein
MPKETSITVTLSTSDGEMIERFAVINPNQRLGAAELAALVHDTVESHYAVGPADEPANTVEAAADQLEAANDRLSAALANLVTIADKLR